MKTRPDLFVKVIELVIVGLAMIGAAELLQLARPLYSHPAFEAQPDCAEKGSAR